MLKLGWKFSTVGGWFGGGGVWLTIVIHCWWILSKDDSTKSISRCIRRAPPRIDIITISWDETINYQWQRRAYYYYKKIKWVISLHIQSYGILMYQYQVSAVFSLCDRVLKGYRTVSSYLNEFDEFTQILPPPAIRHIEIKVAFVVAFIMFVGMVGTLEMQHVKP